MMTALPKVKLCHFGLFAHDLKTMVDFYTRVFGLTVTDWGSSTRGMDIAFLSGNAEEHHQLVIAGGRPKDLTFSTINQVSFRVNDLEELRRYHAWLVNERVQKLETRDHGNAWSIYFSDPEGNRMEIYTPSPWYVAQPFGEPLDLTQPAEAIHAKTEAMVRKDPSWRPMAEWSADMRKKQEQPDAA
jgi:catechol-2,3-dioxygenase